MSSTASTPTTPSSPATCSASASAATACSSLSPGAGVVVSTQMPLRCTDSETGYATAWPDGERTTSALSSRAKSTYSSARICTPAASAGERLVGLGRGPSIFHTPLPS